jgi:hypothetical protein
MQTIKVILITIAAILGLIAALAAIGTIVIAIKYLMVLGFIYLAGLITLKLIKKSEPKQLESKELFPELDFKNVDQVLAKYKEKLSTKD